MLSVSPLDRARRRFLRITTTFQCGMLVFAYLLGFISGIDPIGNLHLNWSGAWRGVAGVFPMTLLFWLLYRYPVGNLRQIRRLLVQNLGPHLARCQWFELLGVALMVGFSEELLFRGLLQPWFERVWGYDAGIIGGSVLFGLAHMVSPAYAVLAALTGAYLGGIMDWGGERNLLVPALTHSVYDFLAFLVIAWGYRQSQVESDHSATPPEL